MRLLSITFFCIFSVVATIGLAYVLYPHAKLSETQLMKSGTPQTMESFEQFINLGDDFGEMSVIDLMGHYLDSPPAAAGAVLQSKPKRQFGGC